MAIFSTRPDKDPTNDPSSVTLEVTLANGVRFSQKLPDDVLISFDGEKVMAESKIIDGTSVFERISRKPFDIRFEFTLREKDDKGNYIFPQTKAKDLIDQIWKQDQVVRVKNTFLNSLGVFFLVLDPIAYTTIRGSTDVLGSIKSKEVTENKNGTTLVIPL